MASVNKVILVGNLGADPEIRYLSNGGAVANIRLATSDRQKDRANNEIKEVTEWHRVVFFGRLAEIVSEYLKRGSLVYIEGRIRTRKWQGQDGTNRYSTEIFADHMRMLNSRGSDDTSSFNREAIERSGDSQVVHGGSSTSGAGHSSALADNEFNEMDDDIPF